MSITKPEEIPNKEHFQIIYFTQVKVDDGYNGSYQTVTNIEIVDDKDILQKRVTEIDRADRAVNQTTKYVVQKIDRICPVTTQVIVS